MRFSVIIVIFTLGHCSPITQPSSSTTAYEEDLSMHRPAVATVETVLENTTATPARPVSYVEPTAHIRAELDSVLKIKALRSRKTGYLKGFTIQVYSGRSREVADNAKDMIYSILTEEKARVTYDQPMYRVKVGRYYSRLEAEKSYFILRDKFPQALVLPERIPLPE